MTQSGAIIRHLARQHSLYGKDAKEQATIDMLDGVLNDWRQSWTRVVYSAEFESVKGKYMSETAPSYAEDLDNWLKSRKWLAGDSVNH